MYDSGDDEASKETAKAWDDDAVSQLSLSSNCVGLKLEAKRFFIILSLCRKLALSFPTNNQKANSINTIVTRTVPGWEEAFVYTV